MLFKIRWIVYRELICFKTGNGQNRLLFEDKQIAAVTEKNDKYSNPTLLRVLYTVNYCIASCSVTLPSSCFIGFVKWVFCTPLVTTACASGLRVLQTCTMP